MQLSAHVTLPTVIFSISKLPELNMKILLSFFAIFSICFNLAVGFSVFKSVKCSSSNITTRSDFKCYIKTYSPKNNTMNLELFLQRNLTNIMVRFYKKSLQWLTFLFQMHYDLSIEKTMNGKIRKLFDTEINFCETMNNIDSNPLFKWLIKLSGNSLSRSLKPCPLEVSEIS